MVINQAKSEFMWYGIANIILASMIAADTVLGFIWLLCLGFGLPYHIRDYIDKSVAAAAKSAANKKD